MSNGEKRRPGPWAWVLMGCGGTVLIAVLIVVGLLTFGFFKTKEIVAHAMRRAQKQGLGDDWESAQAAMLKEMFPNPTGRIAEVEEIGELVAFVASERAAYVNGTNLRIDGGATDAAV